MTQIKIVQRLLRLEQRIVTLSYFLTNEIYRLKGFLAMDFPRKAMCNVFIELFLFYASGLLDRLIISSDE